MVSSALRLVTQVAVHCTVLAVLGDDDDVNLMQTQMRHRVSRNFTADGNMSSSVPEIIAAIGAGAPPETASVLVEKLARASVTTNASIDDATKTALQSLRDILINTEQESIKQSHQNDQNFLNTQFSILQQCDTTLSSQQAEDALRQSQSTSKGSTHVDCRNELSTLQADRDTKCETLASFEAGVRVPSCATPHHDQMASWFARHRAWVSSAEDIWTGLNEACEAATSAYIAKDTACDLNQGQFETDFCTFRVQVHSTCANYDGCFAGALDNYAIEQIAVLDREQGRKLDNTATEKIKCYIDVLLLDEENDARAAKLHECQELCAAADDGPNHCTDHLSIHYHDLPSAQACSRDAVSSYPCVDAFLSSEYAGLIDLRACVACPDLPPHLVEPGVTHDPWAWEPASVHSTCDPSRWSGFDMMYQIPQELDGDSSTRAGCDQGYTLDLGEVRTVSETYIEWEACQCTTYGSAQLLSSLDGESWLPYYHPMLRQWGGHLTKTYRAPVTGRYFRVQVNAPPASYTWFSMWEFRLTPMPRAAAAFPEVRVLLVDDEVLNLQQMQDKCPDGFGLVKLRSADHVRHLAVKYTQAGGDWIKHCGAAIASKTSHNPNRYATLGTKETDVTAFLQEVYDNEEFGGDLWTHQSDQDVCGFGWSDHSGYGGGFVNEADQRQIHDFGGHCSQAVFCEAQ